MAEIVLDRGELKRKIGALKALDRRIIFCNGCFNLLHVGHVRYLEGAKQLGDVLLVAINTDESVRELKGSDYPVVPQAERAEVVAALRCVDFVTLFEEPDVSALLLLLKPDVQAKGSDYTVETIPERETVLGYGGELAITGDPKDHSTSDVMARIATWKQSERKRPS